jgi:hypothetical protein
VGSLRNLKKLHVSYNVFFYGPNRTISVTAKHPHAAKRQATKMLTLEESLKVISVHVQIIEN